MREGRNQHMPVTPLHKNMRFGDLGIERFSGELDLEMALALMGRFVTLHPRDRATASMQGVPACCSIEGRGIWSGSPALTRTFPEETFLLDAIPIVGVDYDSVRVARLDDSGWIEINRNATGSVRRPRVSQ